MLRQPSTWVMPKSQETIVCTLTAMGMTTMVKIRMARCNRCHCCCVPRQPSDRMPYTRRLRPRVRSRAVARSGTRGRNKNKELAVM